MSFLDGLFQNSTEGGDPLEISDTVVTGSATIAPGLMHFVHGVDTTTVLTLVSMPIEEANGKRIAVKVTVSAPTMPGGDLIVAVPVGMSIEDDNGIIGQSAMVGGKQIVGNYREWKCDGDGVWRMLAAKLGDDGTSLPIDGTVISADQVVAPGRIYLVNSGLANVSLTIDDAVANDLIGFKLVGGSGDANSTIVAAGGVYNIEQVDDSHTPQPTAALRFEGTSAIFQLDGNGSVWRLIYYTRGTGSGAAPLPRDLASAIGTEDGFTRVDGAANVGDLLAGNNTGEAGWLPVGAPTQVLTVGPTGELAWVNRDHNHGATHQDGGVDEISVAGLSGKLADPQTPLAHRTSHQVGGGADEMNVTGLSGKLADPQTPLTHKTSHQLGGGDVISVAGLSGELADPQTPLTHAASHLTSGSDPIALATGAADGLMAAASVTKLAGIAAGADVTLTALAAAPTDIAVNGRKITGLANPTNAQDACTKAYADAVTQGLDVKQSCRVIATTNIALTGTQTIDGVAVVAGDRVLCAGQTTGAQNGIYVVAAGAWARATDADTSAEVTSGLFVFVVEGTGNADSGWVLTTLDPIVLGTTALVFAQFSGAGQIQAGAGLTKTGNTINVAPNADGSIVVAADDVRVGVLATDVQHGTRGSGAIHAAVTTSVNGFMSAADKVKLDGIASGADPASNGFLLYPNPSDDSPYYGTYSTVYLIPVKSDRLALYYGGLWIITNPSGVSYALVGRTTDLPFDLFAYWNGSAVALEAVNWTSGSARAIALVRTNGVYTKSGDATRRYLGTARPRSATTYINHTSGTLSDNVKMSMDLWNMDNRVQRFMGVTGMNVEYSYASTAIRPAANSLTAQMEVIHGLPGDAYTLAAIAAAYSTNSALVTVRTGFGVGTTTDMSYSFSGIDHIALATGWRSLVAMRTNAALLGAQSYIWLEAGDLGVSFSGRDKCNPGCEGRFFV